MLLKLRARGQATIPKLIRRQLGLRDGDQLSIRVEGDTLIARKVSVVPAATGPKRLFTHEQLLAELRVVRRAVREIRNNMERIETLWNEDAFLRSHAILKLREARAAFDRIPGFAHAQASNIAWGQLAVIPTTDDPDQAREWIDRYLEWCHITLEGLFLARREIE